MHVTKFIYNDGFEMEVEKECPELIDRIAKAPAILWHCFQTGEGDLKELSEDWYELSCKLLRFWAQIGCPRLPEKEYAVNGGVTYRRL